MILIALQLVGIAILVTWSYDFAKRSSWLWVPSLILAGGIAVSVASHIPA